MAKRTYLDPAHTLIMRFAGQNGKLGDGIDAVAAIVKRDRTSVYRWMLPIEKRGTGGFIPAQAQRELSKRGPEWLREFFGGAKAA